MKEWALYRLTFKENFSTEGFRLPMQCLVKGDLTFSEAVLKMCKHIGCEEKDLDSCSLMTDRTLKIIE